RFAVDVAAAAAVVVPAGGLVAPRILVPSGVIAAARIAPRFALRLLTLRLLARRLGLLSLLRASFCGARGFTSFCVALVLRKGRRGQTQRGHERGSKGDAGSHNAYLSARTLP